MREVPRELEDQEEKRIKRKWNQREDQQERGIKRSRGSRGRGINRRRPIWLSVFIGLAEPVASTHTEERLRAKKKVVSEGSVGWDLGPK
jgi:hypothetical protein